MRKNCSKTVVTGLLIFVMAVIPLHSKEHVELLPFGDFESWTVRYIKESKLIGGKTKALYMVGPNDTIYGNEAYIPSSLSPWGTGNAHAKAFGFDKVSVSVRPDRHNGGLCCRMETILEVISAVGIDLKALAAGSLYTGCLLDPVGLKQGSDPVSSIDMGVPYTRRPKALMLDYKAFIQPHGQVLYADAGTRIKNVDGHDEGQITLILQYRWEENGHIYAYRVGTAYESICASTDGWQNDHRIPIHYEPFGQLATRRFKARNSQGEMVYVEECDFRGDITPTHMILQICSGNQPPFIGCPGNIVWCDNIRIIYP